MIDPARFEWLSFDCYGTLIDWESGILGYLRPLLERKNRRLTDAEILTLYSEFEPREQSGTYRRYGDVLSSVVRDFARKLEFEVTPDEAAGLAGSIPNWQPFPDTVEGLRRLSTRYKLAVLSNIDNALFAQTQPKLGVRLDLVVTAEQVGSYKPSLNNFETLLSRIGAPRERLLHVAESLYHDVAPASSLGVATVWVNRREGKRTAASGWADAKPDLDVSTITALADKLGV